MYAEFMDPIFVETLNVLERAFRRLEQQVPPPIKKPYRDGFLLRYEEKSIHQAILQKCARVISNLAAARVLLKQGFVCEQAILHRAIDEAFEDVLFLVGSASNGAHEERHDQYLEGFWAEEFDESDDPVKGSRGRDTVSRKHIQAYLTRALGDGEDPSRDLAVSRTLSRVFSGYVHGASPQIMEMCVGEPPKFLVFGMSAIAPRMHDHGHDAWNYYYRSLCCLNAAAKAFGDAQLVEQLYDYLDLFEAKTGRSGGERRKSRDQPTKPGSSPTEAAGSPPSTE